MKKKVLGLTMAGLVAMLPVFVNAEEETASEKLSKCMTTTESSTCTLTEDVTITSTIEVTSNIILDLAGYEIASDATTAIKVVSGSLTVKDTSTESTGKIEVSGEAFRMGTKGNAEDDKDSSVLTIEKGVDVISTNDSCVVIYAGTLNIAGNLTTKAGNYATITGSGNDHGTVINVTDGLVRNDAQVAIFQPQNGTLTIDGGAITGTTGIEVRAGKLVVNGGTITGNIKNATEVTVEANGSGSTTTGVGIAVAQHTTLQPIEVVINAGTIKGLAALYESNPQNNSATDIAKVKITVKGGTLETTNEGNKVVYSENNLITVEGGTFNEQISQEIATPEGSEVYEVITEEGIKYVVATEEDMVENTYEAGSFTAEEWTEEITEFEKMLAEVNEEELTEEELKEIQESKDFLAEIKKALDGKTTVSAHDICYGSFIGEDLVIGTDQTKLEKAVEITLNVPETLEKEKEGYTRKYSVVRVHYNEETDKNEISVLDAKEKDGTVTFETDRFSTYILTYEDVANTKNPNTFDGISLYMIIASVSLIGLVSLITYSKKAKNY